MRPEDPTANGPSADGERRSGPNPVDPGAPSVPPADPLSPEQEEFLRELSLIPWLPTTEALPPELAERCARDPSLAGLARERARVDRALDAVPALEPSDDFVFRTVQRVWADGHGVGRDVADPRAGFGRARVGVAVAAALAVGLVIGLLAGHRFGRAPSPEPELLARLDLLLDWELLEAHRDALDVVVAGALMESAAELAEEGEG